MKEREGARSDADFACGLYGRCGISVWRGKMRVEHVQQWVDVMAAAEARLPGPFAWLSVVEPSVPVPEDTVRDAIANTNRGRAERIALVGIAQEGAGLRGTIVRSVVTAMALVGPSTFRPEVFKSVPLLAEAASQKLGNAGFPVASGDVVAAVEQLRARIPAAHSSLRK